MPMMDGESSIFFSAVLRICCRVLQAVTLQIPNQAAVQDDLYNPSVECSEDVFWLSWIWRQMLRDQLRWTPRDVVLLAISKDGQNSSAAQGDVEEHPPRHAAFPGLILCTVLPHIACVKTQHLKSGLGTRGLPHRQVKSRIKCSCWVHQ